MLNNVTDYNTRITLGKSNELNIINYLKSHGYNIELPTAHADMHDKIDGFIIPKSGGRLSFQLKFRESGDDIIYEIIKDWDNNIEGRDLISKAQLYVVVNRQGILSIFKTLDIKTKAIELLKLADANPIDQSGNGWQIKFRNDVAHGNLKLMGYFSTKLFPLIASHRISNYNLN